MSDEFQRIDESELESGKSERVAAKADAETKILQTETEIKRVRIRELNHLIFLKNADLAVSILVILAMLGLIGGHGPYRDMGTEFAHIL